MGRTKSGKNDTGLGGAGSSSLSPSTNDNSNGAPSTAQPETRIRELLKELFGLVRDVQVCATLETRLIFCLIGQFSFSYGIHIH